MKRVLLALLCLLLVAPLAVAAQEKEIVYDNGERTIWSSKTAPSRYDAVRFTAPENYCYLAKARLYLMNEVAPTPIPFEVVVLDSDGSTELRRVRVPGPSTVMGWYWVDFDPPIPIDRDFYIAMHWIEESVPLPGEGGPLWIGGDETVDYYRSYYGPPITPIPVLNWMIRAFVAPCPVGGELIPASRLGMLASLASWNLSAVTIAAVAVAAVLLLKRANSKKER